MSRPQLIRGSGVTQADLTLPLALGTLMLVPLLGFGLDVGLSAIFYTPGKGFTLWHDWLLEKVLHDAGVLTLDSLAALTLEQLQDILPNLHDAAAAKHDFIGQAMVFAQAKADGIDPATIARDNQAT